MSRSILEVKRVVGSISLAERLAFMLLLLLVILAPVPSGAVMPSGTLRLELLCFLSAALAVLGNRSAAPLPVASLIALTAVAGVGAMQLVPLPPDLIERLSPAAAAIYRDANSVLQLFGQRTIEPRISIAPVETVRACLLVLSYVFAFVAAVFLTRRRWQRTVLMGVLLINCLAHVIYAVIGQTEGSRMSGMFMNPNHFAGYLEIGLAFSFALLWAEISSTRRLTHDEDSGEVLERRLIGLTWRVLIWAAIAVAIGFSLSRMAIASAVATTFMMLILAVIHRPGRRSIRQGLTALAVLAVGLTVIIATTGDTPLVRFLSSDPPGSSVRPSLSHLADLP